jgi:two-component system, NtrC family, sensor kinase
VVDSRGHLIAHPDISLVLKKTDLSRLPQVETARAALADAGPARQVVQVERDLQGREVLTTFAPIPSLGWIVFAEQPLAEAFAPLRDSLQRTALLLVLGVGLAVLASLALARRMVTPIQTLQRGAARIAQGDLGHRLEVRTGDELEALADQFNRMAFDLQESYAGLERKVEARTRELREALEQQTATAEILRAISGSPTDTRPVFATVLANATRLCDANIAALFLYDGEVLTAAAHHHTSPAFAEHLSRARLRPSRETPSRLAALERRTVHVADLRADATFAPSPVHQREDIRTVVAVPMLREEQLVGVITVWRREVRPFTDKQIALLQTFADQAVIAIENVRLFTELQEKNRQVTEALEQQTATSEILRAISSSPTDVQPVFDSIARSATRLCGGLFGGVFLREGDTVDLVAHYNFTPEGLAAFRRAYPMPVDTDSNTTRAIRERRPIHVTDVQTDPAMASGVRSIAHALGFRSLIMVPMLREAQALGAIGVSRDEVKPFSDQEIALVQTFADQAVIAIENVRLFTELQEKNRALAEALEQQTATSETLRIISSSPTDVAPVFEAMLDNAARLCSAELGVLFLYEDGRFRAAAIRSDSPAWTEYFSRGATAPSPGSGLAELVRNPRPVHIADLAATAAYRDGDPLRRATVELGGARTFLAMPLLKEGRMVGAFTIYRHEVRPFTDKQIALVQTFADQAVIAIENVRLFQELQARTHELARRVEELTALGEVSRAVSASLDLERVLDAVVSRANQLAGGDGCSIYEYDDDAERFTLRATARLEVEIVEVSRATPMSKGEGAVGQLAVTRAPVEIADIAEAGAYHGPLRDVLVRWGHRAVLALPLIREDDLVGGLAVTRKTPGRFAPEVIGVLQTFASQSALAIQNARLFRELEDKSRQLEVANRHKSEFLANMSHELRTPLNAVIGFSEVLHERMFGELNDKQAEYIEDILSSGRHLLSLINDILDLSKVEAGRMELDLARFSLPVALDNALTLVRERATRHGVTLELDADPRVGDVVADARKVKQILLNLLSNAIKFTPEGGRVTVRAVPADGTVEVAVSDTGIGIAPADQELIFEEFRQAGGDYAQKREGTGLGLALVKRFVELHGGRIWVKSAVGEGSTFTFTLPERSWPAS